jgi:PAS domain S-box-containing protein
MSSGSVETMGVLVVDDNADLVDVVAEFLEREHDAIEATTAASADEALERILSDSPDCIVSDYDMPEKNGLEFLREVREANPDLPFILFTGKGSEEIASEAISAGVTEYLQKGTATEQYTLLANRIERAVSEQRARKRQAETERRFATLVENLPGMAYRCRNERGWPMEYISDGCEEVTGYTAEQLESDAVDWSEEVLHPEDREEMWESVQEALDVGESFQVTYRIRHADGDVRWCWERGRAVERHDGTDILEGFITDITARKRREQELRAEREFTESALNALEDMFFVIDPETEQLVRWNNRVPERTGYTDSEMATMRATDFTVDEHRERSIEAMARAMKEGTTTVEVDVRAADGERIPYEFRGTLIYDEDDEVVGIAAVGRDITEREEREQTLERYRTLVENVADPMYVLDAEGTIEMVNSAMVDHLGYDRAKLIGESSRIFLPEEDFGRGTEVVADLVSDDGKESRTWELQVQTRDGDVTLHENKTAIIRDDGEFVGSVGVVREITQRKKRERELERFETIVQAVGDPVYALDEDGVLTFVNEATAEMTGYDVDTLVGSSIERIIAADGAKTGERHIQEMLSDPESRARTFEVEVRTEDGERVPSEFHIALLPSDDGQFRGTAGIIRDIQERKEREERLERFASVVSHDLRGPLNVILGRVELARQKSELAELDAIAEAADRMNDLIEDLLTLARQGRTVGDLDDVSLSSVAECAWQSVDSDDATLDSWVTLTLTADEERLQELLENLFRNAVEHGSTSSRTQSDDAVEHGSTNPDSQARQDTVKHGGDNVTVTVGRLDDEEGFYVADDGPGIPESERKDVFEHGYTTNEHGTGFGLSIVERIASAHGWDVSITEGAEGGARFEFRTG